MATKAKTKTVAATEPPEDNLNQLSLDALAMPYDTWVRSAGRVQDELLQFFGKRLREDVELSVRLAECSNASEVLEQQMSFATTMFNDYASENLKIMGIVCDTAGQLEHQAEEAVTGPLHTQA